MKNANLRRTSVYASLLGISGVLHLDVFVQPAKVKALTSLLFAKQVKVEPQNTRLPCKLPGTKRVTLTRVRVADLS
jgi:hypothetical protein